MRGGQETLSWATGRAQVWPPLPGALVWTLPSGLLAPAGVVGLCSPGASCSGKGEPCVQGLYLYVALAR